MSSQPWRLEVRAPAVRDLQRLPEKVATAIVESFDAIAGNPRRLGKPLRLELEGQWASRRGPYRVLYTIDDETRTVTVVAIGHRTDVYRRR